MRINQNISALKAYKHLNRSNNKVSQALERLSSGLRINHPADDAAGLAIAHKMDTQIHGLSQANKNAYDGISLVQTAEGSLAEVHAILQRMRELSVQMADGVYSEQDRLASQQEIKELKKEIDKISESTEFNEFKLLNGDLDRITYSDDPEIAEIISKTDHVPAGEYGFEVRTPAKQTNLEAQVTQGAFDVDGKLTLSGKIELNGVGLNLHKGNSQEEVLNKLGAIINKNNASFELVGGGPLTNGKTLNIRLNEYGDLPLNFTGDSNLLNALGLNGTPEQGNDVEIEAIVYDDPVTKDKVEGFPQGTVYEVSGEKIKFIGTDKFEINFETGGKKGAVKTKIFEDGPIDLQIGANEGQIMTLTIPSVSIKSLGIGKVDMMEQERANKSIALLDEAINKVSNIRSKLGAYQNRLEHTVSNLDVSKENLTSSFSRIKDADMALEMAEFTKQTIIQQAGTSMLAQANQRPQSLLQLLQG